MVVFDTFIRGCSVGGINLGLTSDAYQGIDDKQIAEAGVGINMIENIGSSLGTAIIATVVASMLALNHPSILQSLRAYHAGFLVSTVALLLIVLPALFLTHKSKKNRIINTEKPRDTIVNVSWLI